MRYFGAITQHWLRRRLVYVIAPPRL